MGIMGIPESAVYGNASEVPDSESGEVGNPATLQYVNETLPVEIMVVEEVSHAETEGMVHLTASEAGQMREALGGPREE